jgi:hypothetical protein
MPANKDIFESDVNLDSRARRVRFTSRRPCLSGRGLLADHARQAMFGPLPRVRRDMVLASRLFKHLLEREVIVAAIDF